MFDNVLTTQQDEGTHVVHLALAVYMNCQERDEI